MVLKSDVLGRVKTPLTRRQSLLEEFEKSGLSGSKFAALAGVKYSTFISWVQKQRRTGGRAKGKAVDAASQVRWLEAVIEQAQAPGTGAGAALQLQLPGGARVEIATAGQAVLAARLLRALENPASAC